MLLFEKLEPWESEKTEADMERYFWSGSGSEDRLIDIVRRSKAAYEDTKEAAKVASSLQITPGSN